MKEILSIHIGQCGVQVAEPLWELFCIEHGIQLNGKNKDEASKAQGNSQTLFKECSNGAYTARSIMIDLQPTVIDEVRKSKIKKLFSPSNMLAGKQDTGNNYIRGHYTIGKQLVDLALDRIRKQIQITNNAQAIIITHSINGGTGSGFTSLLLQRLAIEFPKKVKVNFCVYPSAKFSDTIVETYNAVLACSSLLQHTDLVVPFANQNLYNIFSQQLDIQNPNFFNINSLIAKTISNFTASSRLPGIINPTIPQLLTNLIPYPRTKFISTSFNTFSNSSFSRFKPCSIHEITKEVFDLKNYVIDERRDHRKFMACNLLYRGPNIYHSQAITALQQIRTQSTVKFVDWVLTGSKVGINSSSSLNVPNSGIQTNASTINMFSNNIAITKIFQRVDYKFDHLYAKRAFVHWYVGEGLDEGFFSQARENMAALQKDFEEGGVEYFEDQQYYYGIQQQQMN